ncbi:SET domain-containing protein [Hymenopellis radicata]|nr:SET domain-containing protein [Hymenopellis radicata]
MESASSAASDDSDIETPARSPTPPKSDPRVFGGFRVKRWADIREDLRRQQPKYLLARDLPSRLQDYINNRPAESRGHPQMRRLFEHEIYINSADTEHDAPEIKVENSVDDEPCPPWEFYYTNEMWHTDDIPPPTREGLVGCDCVGDCSTNKNCACRKHQLEKAGEYASGDFAYHPDGRVKVDARGVPIWECNDMCRCDGHCVNRVVQRGRKCPVKIVKTLEKGWGVFYCGPKKLPEGSFVGIYSGELVTFDVGEQRGPTYDQSGRTYMLDLDFYHIRQKYENDHRLSIDAYHAGNNHSCAPNCCLQPVYINDGELKKPLMAFFTLKDLLPEEELTFSYFGELDRIDSGTEKQEDPKAVFAPCRCGAKMCIGMWNDSRIICVGTHAWLGVLFN